ncbi:hypothetical protein GCM10010400_03730 [Streptomyces aculeolatus]
MTFAHRGRHGNPGVDCDAPTSWPSLRATEARPPTEEWCEASAAWVAVNRADGLRLVRGLCVCGTRAKERA